MMSPVLSTGTTARVQRELPRPNVIAFLVVIGILTLGLIATVATKNPFPIIVAMLLAPIVAQSPKIAKQWDKAVVLRLGRFVGLRGPGLFWIVPFIALLLENIAIRLGTVHRLGG